jgi:enoyl-[acyl-carrier protein] reductase II
MKPGVGALRKAVQDGDIDFGSVMAGQIAGLIKEEKTCREIIEELFSETRKHLREAGTVLLPYLEGKEKTE